MGLLLFGEKRTHDTHSEWLSSWGEQRGRVQGEKMGPGSPIRSDPAFCGLPEPS